MGDIEYITAFQRIIMPIAYEFNPELVIVSAGFDAAIGDPIGHYNVTPEAYGYFTHWLSTLANGRIILCLEGGYNVNSISHAMAMCTKALLGDPLPMLQSHNKKPNTSCIETIQKVLEIQGKYWNSLKFNKKLPDFSHDNNLQINVIDKFTNAFDNLQCADSDTRNTTNNEKSSDTTNSNSSSNQTTTPDEPQPGPSKPTENIPNLMDFLKDQEGYAVYPLKTCPHLTLLDPDNAPACKFVLTSILHSIKLISFHYFS